MAIRKKCYIVFFCLLTGCTREMSVEQAPLPAAPVTPAEAQYHFDAAPGACPAIEMFGQYQQNVVLGAGDSVRIPVVVTNPGTYTVHTATVNSMVFSASGTFDHAGADTLILTGTGTPGDTGSFAFPVTAAAVACSFPVHVAQQIDTLAMYWRFTAEGVTHYGYISDSLSIIGPDSTSSEFLYIYGKALPDSINYQYLVPFQLLIYRTYHNITTGTYSSLSRDDFYAGMIQIHDHPPGFAYVSVAHSPAVVFRIQLLDFDVNGSGLVRGTFGGSVYKQKVSLGQSVGLDVNPPVVEITDGYFQGYLKKQ